VIPSAAHGTSEKHPDPPVTIGARVPRRETDIRRCRRAKWRRWFRPLSRAARGHWPKPRAPWVLCRCNAGQALRGQRTPRQEAGQALTWADWHSRLSVRKVRPRRTRTPIRGSPPGAQECRRGIAPSSAHPNVGERMASNLGRRPAAWRGQVRRSPASAASGHGCGGHFQAGRFTADTGSVDLVDACSVALARMQVGTQNRDLKSPSMVLAELHQLSGVASWATFGRTKTIQPRSRDTQAAASAPHPSFLDANGMMVSISEVVAGPTSLTRHRSVGPILSLAFPSDNVKL